MKTKFSHKVVLAAVLAIALIGFSTQASAVSFNYIENAGFVLNTLRSIDDGTHGLSRPDPQNNNNTDDIKWYQDTSSPYYNAAGAPLGTEVNTIVWGYTFTNGYTNNNGGLWSYTDSNNNPTSPIGVNNGYSALQVFGQASPPQIVADGGFQVLTRLFHQNNEIRDQVAALASAKINGQVTISPTNGGSLIDDSVDPITFEETLGLNNPDYFTVGLAVFTPLTFRYGAHNYEVIFDLYAGPNVSIEYPDANTIKVWTNEHGTNELDVLIAIRTIPEPATMLLLGLGLLGLGFIKRRKG
jgi:hypothetical protein